MIAIRSNFFYTRAVPCELWFLNRNKPEEHKGLSDLGVHSEASACAGLIIVVQVADNSV